MTNLSKAQKYQSIDGLLSTQEVADELGVTRGRVKHLVSAGRIPAYRIGKTLVFKAAELALVKHRPLGKHYKPWKAKPKKLDQRSEYQRAYYELRKRGNPEPMREYYAKYGKEAKIT